MDISRLSKPAAQHRKLHPLSRRHTPDNQAFSRIVQHRKPICAHLLKNAVRQTSEAQDVDIHNPFPVMQTDQILLRLHRKLVGHKDKKTPLRFSFGTGDNLLIDIGAFSGSGRTGDKLQRHRFFLSSLDWDCCSQVVTVHTRHSQKRIFDTFRCSQSHE